MLLSSPYVFDLDMARCPQCRQGTLRIITAITQGEVIGKNLRHLKLSCDPAAIAKARLCQGRREKMRSSFLAVFQKPFETAATCRVFSCPQDSPSVSPIWPPVRAYDALTGAQQRSTVPFLR
jgi:hypothetical protein